MASSSKSDAWKTWEKSGKSEISKYLKTLSKGDVSPFFLNVDGKNPIFRYIYDLLNDGIRGTTKKDTVLAILADISGMHAELPSVILDIIGIFDAETASGLGESSTPEDRTAFIDILKEAQKFLSEKLLKERLEIDTLQDIGTIKNNNFYTKFIKVKTKLYYKQRRFNLFREETEGYAKLITELNDESIEKSSVLNILEIVKSLIGCFNLDPNRVLDIILESFETRPEQHHLFIELLRTYMPNADVICEILGYKYRYFADGGTPNSLYIITALLLQCGLIQLDKIYAWLAPTDRSLQADWEQELDDAKKYKDKLNIISTNKDKEMEVDVEKDDDDYNYELNQKLNLCEALLSVGDWKTVQLLIDRLPEHSVVTKESVAKALANLIHYVIDPIYSKLKNRQSHASLPYQNELSVSKAETMPELLENAIPMAIKLGPALHHDPILMYKLIRIMNSILTTMNVDASNGPKTESDQQLYYNCISVIDASILPALSYMDCNCCVAEEIWSIMKMFPYNHRYSLYARWKNDTYLIHPKLIRRRADTQKKIKALIKRVSKENVKPVGRSIGKLSHCSPGALFEYILQQVQIYDNLIGPVVDSLKYLTSLSYDVLGYCMIETLSQVDRNRFKHDGTSLSMWLQNSANFCGAIFKKYNIELSGLLQYVANQLKSHKSLDLLILKEVCQKMTGVEASEEMTMEQLEAMSGGELLRNEAGHFGQVRNTKKSSQRLKDALANNDLAVSLCLLMAQQKHCVVYRETANNHLKSVGKLYDQCQDTLVQFGTFLGSSYSVDEYMERLPSIHQMLQEYNIHTEVAFFLARPVFAHQISQKYDQLRKSDGSSKKLSTAQKQEKYLEATSAIIQPIVDSVRLLHPIKVWEDISPQFLVTFWSLSMYDLEVPIESYQREINKLKKLALTGSDSKDMNSSKGRKEQERYHALTEKLQDERKKQQEHVDKIKHRLNNEKDQWFLSRAAKSAKNETITQFLQLCLFPRCTFTAPDAIYCAKFVQLIHELKTPNFSTLLCYDRIFCEIAFSVTSCTENEATRYGRFLSVMLETVMRWHADPSAFEKECVGYPGFVTKFRISNQDKSGAPQCSADDRVGYENFRHVCHKWHYKITRSLVMCLSSKDYMQIRNALIILMRILPNYPVLQKLSKILERYVNIVIDEEKNKRQDLFVLARSYIGQLRNKANEMLKEADFHQVNEKKSSQESVKVVNGNGNISATKNHEIKEPTERPEKKSTSALPIASSSVATNSNSSVKHSTISTNNISEKEQRKENKEREREIREREKEKERESTEKVITIKESKRDSSKESKRDKDEGEIVRKRDRGEKRRDRERNKIATPPSYYNDRYDDPRAVSPQFYDRRSPSYHPPESNDRFHGADGYNDERDRDLSSISNSSKGSTNRRSQESPDNEREMKRRRLENSKKNEEVTIVLDEGSKRERASNRSKEKREKSSYEDIDVRKDKRERVSRKRNL